MRIDETIDRELAVADALVVPLGDATALTRGSGGSGSDDKRYTYNQR